MEVGKLTVSVRGRSGKGGSRKLRAQGKVPGVCYGASVEGRIEPLTEALGKYGLADARRALDREVTRVHDGAQYIDALRRAASRAC